MKLPASDASSSVAPISSLASPKRFAGVCPIIDAIRSGLSTFLFCSAGKKPGTMVLTRTLASAHSRARFLERLCTAALVAEYVKTRESGMMPLIEPMLMMLPPSPRSTRYLPKICEAKSTALRLVLRILSNSSSSMSKIGVGEFTPAPFTRMSTFPDFARTLPSNS